MAAMEQKIRVMIVDDIPETRDNFAKLVMFERDIEVIDTAGSGAEAIEKARQLQPDVILMDINMPDMDGLRATEIITAELPGVAVIIMSVQSEQDYFRRAMMVGARQFLIKPCTGDELVDSIRQVYRLEANKRRVMGQYQMVPAHGAGGGEDGNEQGRIFTIFSPKGGVGCTVLAANLAVALRQTTNKKVALVDGNLFFGNIDVMLNVISNKTINEVVSRIDQLDEELLRDVMITHSSGVRVLLAPVGPELAEYITPDHMRRILTELRRTYDYVIVDTWPSFQEIVLAMLDLADRILLMMTLELPAIKHVKQFLEVQEKLGYAPDKVLLVLNRADSKLGIRTDLVEDSLRKKVTANLASDGRAVTMAVNQGVPLVISARDNQFAKDVLALAKLLTTLKPVEVADAAPTAAAKKADAPGGLFARFLPTRR
jgi:pilus assembly protein CpaE